MHGADVLICPECFGSKGLRRRLVEVRAGLPKEHCDFHPGKKGIPVELLAEIVDPVFRENYVGGVPDGQWDDNGDELSQILADLTQAVEDDVVTALAGALLERDGYWPPDGGEPFYSDEFSYVPLRPGKGEHGKLWESFRRSLLHKQRFFSSEAAGLIARIFEGIQHQRDIEGKSPVYLIRPGEPQSRFLRARVADGEQLRSLIRADIPANLGPPPERSRRAGRLNPAGISAFYAAFDFATCVAELRPSVGSVVAAATFEITEEILVLDTTRFNARPKEPDPFARQARRRSAQWRFLRGFMMEIARPIAPGDEHLDYIPTQAVAEYLAHDHSFVFDGKERTIDAIIYGSAQRPAGRNIALLGEAAVCGPAAIDRKAEKARADALDEQLFGWSYPDNFEDQVRIVPVAGTLVIEVVGGAEFRTREFAELDEYDQTESDMLD